MDHRSRSFQPHCSWAMLLPYSSVNLLGTEARETSATINNKWRKKISNDSLILLLFML